MLLLILPACTRNHREDIVRGIYFWKTNFILSSDEFSWLNEAGIKKLYVRFFDVDWNPAINIPIPVGDVTIQTKDVSDMELIPVIFITNRTLINIPDSLLPELSENIYNKIYNKLTLLDSMAIKEIQLDCDWTKSTKEKYFTLIELMKRLCMDGNILITATIRLHQVKFYEQTGVPPVNRAMLMFYNMSDVSDFRTMNSIFDKDIALKYLVNFDKYPLELDVVLPAFSWVCLFRNNKLKNLINEVYYSDLETNPNFVKEGDVFFRAIKNCYLKGIYISAGDYLRIEKTDAATTLLAAEMIAPYLQTNKITVSIYHLNNEMIKNYDKHYLENIFAAFN